LRASLDFSGTVVRGVNEDDRALEGILEAARLTHAAAAAVVRVAAAITFGATLFAVACLGLGQWLTQVLGIGADVRGNDAAQLAFAALAALQEVSAAVRNRATISSLLFARGGLAVVGFVDLVIGRENGVIVVDRGLASRTLLANGPSRVFGSVS
jgi:hypothetical protein